MILKVPYFKQDTDYTCGPTSLQMVLDFFGKFKSEAKLAKEVHCRKETGSSHIHIIEAVRREGFRCREKHEASIEDLKESLKEHLPAIVNYTEPVDNADHYAVVIGFSHSNIILNDPADGQNFRISEKEFFERWHSAHCRRWMLVVYPR